MSVSNYSYKAAGFWAAIMGRVCEDLPRGSYFDMPNNVVRTAGEYYIKGTYSKVTRKKSKKKTEENKTNETTQATTAPVTPTTDTQATTSPPPTQPSQPTQPASTSNP